MNFKKYLALGTALTLTLLVLPLITRNPPRRLRQLRLRR